MIIKVRQTEANAKNKFAIEENSEVKFLAGTPWLNIDSPLDVDKKRVCTITDKNEKPIFYTDYSVRENVANNIIPLKWVFTKSQKTKIYNIVNQKNENKGKIYTLINDFLDTKQVIEYEDYGLICYNKSVGKTHHIFIYNDDKQIAEIVKPLHRQNNLDYYYVFLLDEYQDLEVIISFYTILYDYLSYSDSEIVGHKDEVEVSYTWDKNSKYYNKDWIFNNFPKKEVDKIYEEMALERQEASNKIKKYSQKILLLVILGWVIVLIIFFSFYFLKK